MSQVKLMSTILTFTLLIFFVAADRPVTDPNRDQNELINLVKQVPELHQVTKKRFIMDPETAQLCAKAKPDRQVKMHTNKYAVVHVNDRAKPVITAGEGTYPEGSVIIKSKYDRKDSTKVELYTIMRKMKKGYDPKRGDWEYSVLSGDGRGVLASGKIDSCIRCHRNYTETDYVTRAYLEK